MLLERLMPELDERVLDADGGGAVTMHATPIGGAVYSSMASISPQPSAIEAGTRRIDNAI